MTSSSSVQDAVSGAQILNEIGVFTREVLYAPDVIHDVLGLAFAVSHNIDIYATVPRMLAVSSKPQSGKSTVLDLARMLCANTWMANPTSYALRARFNNAGPGTRTTFIRDEISKIFGASGMRGQSNPLYELLVESYRRTATLALSVDRTATDVSSYCMAWLAGLQTAAPPDLRSRSIIMELEPIPSDVPELRSSVDPDVETEAFVHRERLHQWVMQNEEELRAVQRSFQSPHRKLRGRLLQIWGPLFMIAAVADEDWPVRALRAFKQLALDVSEKPVLSPSQLLLRDVAAMYRQQETDRLWVIHAIAGLRRVPDVELYKTLQDKRLAQLLTRALGAPVPIRIGNNVARGWYADAVVPRWVALEAQLSAADEPEPVADVWDALFEVVPASPDDDTITPPSAV